MVVHYIWRSPHSKVHGANMGPTWVLSSPGGPHVATMNLATWVRTPKMGSQDILFSWIQPTFISVSLQWCHNEHDGVSNHQPHDSLLSRLFRHRSKKKSKLRVTGLCEGNSPVTGEFPAQRASNAENVSLWWRHHDGIGISPQRASDAEFFYVDLNKWLNKQPSRRSFEMLIMTSL